MTKQICTITQNTNYETTASIFVIIEQNHLFSHTINQNIKVSSIPVVNVIIMQQISGLLNQINTKQDTVKYSVINVTLK